MADDDVVAADRELAAANADAARRRLAGDGDVALVLSMPRLLVSVIQPPTSNTIVRPVVGDDSMPCRRVPAPVLLRLVT